VEKPQDRFRVLVTGELSEAASKLIATRATSVRPTKYNRHAHDAEAIKKMAKLTNDATIT